jgi:hypothetical protein
VVVSVIVILNKYRPKYPEGGVMSRKNVLVDIGHVQWTPDTNGGSGRMSVCDRRKEIMEGIGGLEADRKIASLIAKIAGEAQHKVPQSITVAKSASTVWRL